jgi:hypothetical protein
MFDMRAFERSILANGRVAGHDLEELRQRLYVDGKIERRAADCLVELHKRVQHSTPAFEHFYYQAIKDHMLADGLIDADRTAWLRQLILSGDTIHDEDRRLLHELKGEARQVSREFEALFAESMKQPPEQRTCG